MINGLLLDVKSSELKGILEERLKYHEDKRDLYELKAKELNKMVAGIEDDMQVGKVSGGTPVENLERQAKDHKEKAGYFKFMLDHVIQDDIYRLDQSDLVRLGITVRVY